MLPCYPFTSHFREQRFPELEDLMVILLIVIMLLANSFHQKTFFFSCFFARYFWDQQHFTLAVGKSGHNRVWIFLEQNPNEVFLVKQQILRTDPIPGLQEAVSPEGRVFFVVVVVVVF